MRGFLPRRPPTEDDGRRLARRRSSNRSVVARVGLVVTSLRLSGSRVGQLADGVRRPLAGSPRSRRISRRSALLRRRSIDNSSLTRRRAVASRCRRVEARSRSRSESDGPPAADARLARASPAVSTRRRKSGRPSARGRLKSALGRPVGGRAGVVVTDLVTDLTSGIVGSPCSRRKWKRCVAVGIRPRHSEIWPTRWSVCGRPPRR